MTIPVRVRLSVAACALVLCGCGAGPGPSDSAVAKLVYDESPNPVHVGNRPVLTVKEVGGVAVTAQKATFRYYDAAGNLLHADTYTDTNAWFTCQNTPTTTFQRLEANETCTLTQSLQTQPAQFEFDQYVVDDNHHSLMFTTPRLVVIP